MWLATPELAVQRVLTRVREGEHNIPKPVILRRYDSGLRLFFSRYMTIADNWMFFDNTDYPFAIVAKKERETIVYDKTKWDKIVEKYE